MHSHTKAQTNSVPPRLNSSRSVPLACLIAALCVGAFLRIYPSATADAVGFDEKFYSLNASTLTAVGLAQYPRLVQKFLEVQRQIVGAIIPPTRVTFICAASLWQRTFHCSAGLAVRSVACLGSVLALLVGAIFLVRASGLHKAAYGAALLACAPLGIQLGQRAYIDGFFAFWAVLTLWTFWEASRKGRHPAWLWAYSIALGLTILTKENSLFLCAGISVLFLAQCFKEKRLDWALAIATVAGGLLGLGGLIVACGGLSLLLEVLRSNRHAIYQTSYLIKTGDGPWFRYFIDLLALSPLATILAIAAFCQWRVQDQLTRYFTLFLSASYLLMANLTYGISVRYTAMWELPLRWLALTQLIYLASRFPLRFRNTFLIVAVALVCVVDLHQYALFFVRNGIYDPAPELLLHSLQVLK